MYIKTPLNRANGVFQSSIRSSARQRGILIEFPLYLRLFEGELFLQLVVAHLLRPFEAFEHRELVKKVVVDFFFYRHESHPFRYGAFLYVGIIITYSTSKGKYVGRV